jgi:hypothetical protein
MRVVLQPLIMKSTLPKNILKFTNDKPGTQI